MGGLLAGSSRARVQRMRAVHAGDDCVIQQVERFSHYLHGDLVVDGNVAGNAEIEVVKSWSDDAVTTDLRGPACGGGSGRGAHGAPVDVSIRTIAGLAGGTTVHGSAHAQENRLPAGGDDASRKGKVIERILD